MSTIAAALGAARKRLAAAGVESAALDARLLLAHALGVDTAHLVGHGERLLRADELVAFDALLARRTAREPVALILGRREFWSLDFAVTGATLVPRPETETLVEAALAALGTRSGRARILDLGTGSGCILLALLHERRDAQGLGIDASSAAVAVAEANARRLGLAARATFRQQDWREALDGEYDLVVSNPPYVSSADIAALAAEIRLYEPVGALDGGPDGCDAYRSILGRLDRWLAPDGIALLEIGAGQAERLRRLVAQQAGLVCTGFRRDLAGIERVVAIRRA